MQTGNSPQDRGRRGGFLVTKCWITLFGSQCETDKYVLTQIVFRVVLDDHGVIFPDQDRFVSLPLVKYGGEHRRARFSSSRSLFSLVVTSEIFFVFGLPRKKKRVGSTSLQTTNYVRNEQPAASTTSSFNSSLAEIYGNISVLPSSAAFAH